MPTSGSHEAVDHLLAHLKAHRDELVVDGDTHISDPGTLPTTVRERLVMTPNYFHGKPISKEDLLNEMTQAGVDVSLIWQNPAATVYTGDRETDHGRLLAANRYIRDAAVTHSTRFIPAGWTDPKALGAELAIDIVGTCVQDFGFPIIKMNPAQNAFPIDSPEVFAVADQIVALGAIPAFHFGADTPYTPADGLERVARRYANTRIIAVHMGGGGCSYLEGEELYQQTRELGLRCPNLFFIQSAKRDAHIESDFISYQVAGAPYDRNIAVGSDAPYGRQTWNFGGYRAMFDGLMDPEHHTDPRVEEGLFTEKAVRNYMGRNLIDLVVDGYEKMAKT